MSASWRSSRENELVQPIPIYIGKSDPPGGRKGAYSNESGTEEVLAKKPQHRKLAERLRQHGASIQATTNLRLEDFHYRYMLVDEIWVALGEARLIAWFKPVWNILIDGFGSKTEGGGRDGTARSVWDIIHPGRKENLSLQVVPELEEALIRQLRSATSAESLRDAIKAHHEAKRAFRKTKKS